MSTADGTDPMYPLLGRLVSSRDMGREIKLLGVGTGPPDPSAALKRRRRCWFAGKWVDTPVYEGASLKGGNVIPGPAIIEEPTTAVVIRDGFRCTTDQFGYYVLTRVPDSENKGARK